MDEEILQTQKGEKARYEEINERIEASQKLSRDEIRPSLIDFFRMFIGFHKRKKETITTLEIAYLSDKKKYKKFKEIDLDDFYKPIIDTIKRTLFFIGRENDELLSKLLFNTFNNIIIRHVIFGKITDRDNQLAEFLADLLLSYLKNPDNNFNYSI